jgi:hypothetical protein
MRTLPGFSWSSLAAKRLATVTSFLIAGIFTLDNTASAMPAFARDYGVSCNVCHAAYPRLNDFGERFAGEMNFRLANWRDHTVQTGDETLALAKALPLAARMQGFVQARDAELTPNPSILSAARSLPTRASTSRPPIS